MKHTLGVLGMIAIVLANVACTHLVIPTVVPAPQGLSPLPTRTLEPLVNRRWQAPPVLIELMEGPCVICNPIPTVPRFVLYADGQLILSLDVHFYRTVLARESVCVLLREIEADGFFDLEPNQYKPISMTDASTTFITVMAWRTQRISAYALATTLNNNLPVPEPLVKTWMRLRNYKFPDEEYFPERVALKFNSLTYPLNEPVNWNSELSLGVLERQSKTQGDIVLVEGKLAHQALAQFSRQWRYKDFRQNGWYNLSINPLLPLQRWDFPKERYPQPYAYPLTPTTEIDCNNP